MNPPRRRRPGLPFLAGWLLAIALAGGAAAQSGPDDVTLNFVNTEIEGMVMVISEITGKNFVLDPRVKGTISIVSAKPLPREVVYDVFLSALRLQGYAAVESGDVVRIVPEAEAKLYPSPSGGMRVRAAGGQVMGEPMAIPGVGDYVAFTDTEGNRLSMLQPS